MHCFKQVFGHLSLMLCFWNTMFHPHLGLDIIHSLTTELDVGGPYTCTYLPHISLALTCFHQLESRSRPTACCMRIFNASMV